MIIKKWEETDSITTADFEEVVRKKQAARGPNTKQMIKIAENSGFSTKEKKAFYRAVRKYKGEKWLWQQCYLNSQDFFRDSELGVEKRDELDYREGFFVNGKGWTVPHAWLEWRGKVLDLTYAIDNPTDPQKYIAYYEKESKETEADISFSRITQDSARLCHQFYNKEFSGGYLWRHHKEDRERYEKVSWEVGEPVFTFNESGKLMLHTPQGKVPYPPAEAA